MLRGSLKKCLLIAGTLSICFYGMKKSQVILEVKSDQSHIIINNPPKNTTSFTTTPKVTAYNPPTFLDTIEMRVKKVEEFCETQPHKDARIGPLLVLKERNLVWCPVYKSGTSAWMTYLVHLSTKSATEKKTLIVKNPTSTIKLGRSVAPQMSTSSWNMWLTQHEATTRFIIVRHPFDRLVSAFRDKLERSNQGYYSIQQGYYMKKYGKEIVTKYRAEYLEKFGADSLSKINNYGAIIPVTQGKEGKVRTANMPTFWEFIQWFLRNHKSHANEHWCPMIDYCSVCSMNYNYILKFEHYAEENLEFMKSVNLDQYLPEENNFHKIVNGNHQRGMSSTEITKLYFEVLSNDEILKLFEIYQSDFRLFGYSFTFRNVTYS